MQLALFDTDRAEFPGEQAIWDVTMTEINPDLQPDAPDPSGVDLPAAVDAA